jgi:release factor glutamine methyltransferase
MRATAKRHGTQQGITVSDLVRELTDCLVGAPGIDRPEVDARELLAALLDEPRYWPTLNRDQLLSPSVRQRARDAAAKRRRGAPIPYCVGAASFRHLTLAVDERVLIPRPETEQLVDIALSISSGTRGGIAVDVGTGSGAIALALAIEGAFDRVIATDISQDALAVARSNAQRLRDRLRVPVEFRQGSLLAPLSDVCARLVVSNPPYIANGEARALPVSVRDWEPPVALLSGSDGLRVTARLLREAGDRVAPGGALLLEVDSRRAAVVGNLARTDARFADVTIMRDLAGRERFIVARRKEEG